jgi:TRAP transporter TAXI family solute receptor
MKLRRSAFSLIAAASVIAGMPAIAQDAQLRVATATSTGTFYQNGIAMEVLFREMHPTIEIFPQASGGSGENTRLVRDGEVELFFGQNSTVIPAYEGVGQFEGDPNETFSAIGAVWQSVTHVIVAEDSGIEAVADFAGKRIQIGPVGSGIERFTQQPMEASGVTFEDVEAQRLGVAETVDMMRNGRLDGFIHAAIIPDRNAADIMSTGLARIVAFDGEAAERLMAEHPYYGEAVIPANSYENQPDDVPTVASFAVLYASNDVSEDVIYEVTKTMYQNQQFLIERHSSFNDMTLEMALEGLGPVPLHPGAERFYREAGILQ